MHNWVCSGLFLNQNNKIGGLLNFLFLFTARFTSCEIVLHILGNCNDFLTFQKIKELLGGLIEDFLCARR